MNTKSHNNNFLIFAIIGFALTVILAVIGCTITINDVSANNPGVVISKEFEISSSVTNTIKQEYTTTISGKIKNTSKKYLTDVTLVFKVKTNFLQHSGTIEYKLDSLPSNYQIDINFPTKTNENFETIETVFLRYNNQQFEVGTTHTLIGNTVYVIVVFATLVISIVFVSMNKKHKEKLAYEKAHELENLEKIVKKERLKAELKDLTKDDSEIQELEQEVKKEKLKAELKQITTTEIYCKYCGCKNKPDAQKCIGCGSNID